MNAAIKRLRTRVTAGASLLLLTLVSVIISPASAQTLITAPTTTHYSVRSSLGTEELTVGIFGPQRFIRASAQPESRTEMFSLPPMVHGPFMLIVENGSAAGTGRVSSARIVLNGKTILGPSDFNQQKSHIERNVTLLAQNTLEVELRGKPEALLSVELTGKVAPDRTTSEVIERVTTSGGVITIPDVARLSIPPGAVDAADIQLATVDSPIIDFLQPIEVPGLTPLALPKIRIKSSMPLNQPVYLQLPVPELGTLVPEGYRPVFVATAPQFGDNGEEIDGLIQIEGEVCGDDAICTTILPHWFAQTNPFDPLDPVIVVGVNLTNINFFTPADPHLWTVSNVQPPQNGLTVSTRDVLTVNAEFHLDKNFTFSPNSPLSYITPATVDACTKSGYGYRPQFGDFHSGVDLKTRFDANCNASPGERGLPISNVLPGQVTWAAWHPKTGYGNLVKMTHGSAYLQTRYAHLDGFLTFSGQQKPFSPDTIALSGATGGGNLTGPHLHFETLLDGYPIDPVPLLKDNLDLYLNKPSDPVFLQVTISGGSGLPIPILPASPPEIVTSNRHNFSEQIDFGQLSTLGLVPGNYTMALKLNSDSLGVRVLHEWTVTVVPARTLTVTKTGAGSGTVISTPAGINCTSNCTSQDAPFADGSTVMLTAVEDNGSTFDGWGGDCVGTARSTTITLTADVHCVASFRPVQQCPEISGAVSLTADHTDQYQSVPWTVSADSPVAAGSLTGSSEGTSVGSLTYQVQLQTSSGQCQLTASLSLSATGGDWFVVPGGRAAPAYRSFLGINGVSRITSSCSVSTGLQQVQDTTFCDADDSTDTTRVHARAISISSGSFSPPNELFVYCLALNRGCSATVTSVYTVPSQ